MSVDIDDFLGANLPPKAKSHVEILAARSCSQAGQSSAVKGIKTEPSSNAGSRADLAAGEKETNLKNSPGR